MPARLLIAAFVGLNTSSASVTGRLTRLRCFIDGDHGRLAMATPAFVNVVFAHRAVGASAIDNPIVTMGACQNERATVRAFPVVAIPPGVPHLARDAVIKAEFAGALFARVNAIRSHVVFILGLKFISALAMRRPSQILSEIFGGRRFLVEAAGKVRCWVKCDRNNPDERLGVVIAPSTAILASAGLVTPEKEASLTGWLDEKALNRFAHSGKALLKRRLEKTLALSRLLSPYAGSRTQAPRVQSE